MEKTHAKIANPRQGTTIVRVAVPIPLETLFDYSVPPHSDIPPIGGRVTVPFSGRILVGICVERSPKDPHEKPKDIIESLDIRPILSKELLDLAKWMSNYYFYPLGEVLATILPAQARKGQKLEIKREEVWRIKTGYAASDRAPRQKELLKFLETKGGQATLNEIKAEGFSSSIVKALSEKQLIYIKLPEETSVKALHIRQEAKVPVMNEEQVAVLKNINQNPDGFVATLIEGVTGSGKTEIYLRMIEAVCLKGKQALVLVPEIALTPQTLSRFKKRFGPSGVVTSLHSDLSDSERLQTWLKSENGEVQIVIGTRSAILTPFKDLGLIVVDEEHDSSFKQNEGLRYSARDVAAKRAQDLDIPILFGSATPALETLNNADKGLYGHLYLKQRVADAKLPRVKVIDIRGLTLKAGLSNEMLQTLKLHLKSGNQALIFLNRRGFAPTYLCSSCGWIKTCGNCDSKMTLHRKPEVLVCHQCGCKEPVKPICEKCNGQQLKPLGLGTQRTEETLSELFPEVPLIRIDRDNVKSHLQMQKQLDRINKGTPAILVGTQMLAKGHHFPKVTLVGIVDADSGFLSSDFRAPERTAQLITQVAGRAGRAERSGEVCIQTYQPDNLSLRSLIKNGYGGFARKELGIRKKSRLPPYQAMALIRAESEKEAEASTFLSELANAINGDLEVLGPVAAPIARIDNRFRYQLLLLATTRTKLHDYIARIKLDISRISNGQIGVRKMKTGRKLKWSIDIDPYDTF